MKPRLWWHLSALQAPCDQMSEAEESSEHGPPSLPANDDRGVPAQLGGRWLPGTEGMTVGDMEREVVRGGEIEGYPIPWFAPAAAAAGSAVAR